MPPLSPATLSRRDDPLFALTLAVGTVMIAFGARRHGTAARAIGIAGAGVLAAAIAPRLARRNDPAPGARGAIDVSTEFVVHRPRSAVFAFFRNFENIPLLGGIVHSVDDYDDGRSRWRAGANGFLVEWDVIVTKYVPPNVIAWESTPGAPVESTGTLRFEALDANTTRIHVQLHYRAISAAAQRLLRGAARQRPEQRIRAAIRRIDDAMERALQPDVHHRAPRFPLPEQPVSELTPPPADPSPPQP